MAFTRTDPRVTAVEALIEARIGKVSGTGSGRPFLLSIAGSQGSGKSTLTRKLARRLPKRLGLRVAYWSLDDVYLPKAARQALAQQVHPMLLTRGVPGTHDLGQLNGLIDALSDAGPDEVTPIPVFDKLADDPKPRRFWRRFRGRPDVIIVEGWCMGATAQPAEALVVPVNELEATQDGDGAWRRGVNAHLSGDYGALFDRFDAFVHLLAPDFSVVHAWRCQQQEGLLGRPLSAEERDRIADFIAYYKRMTSHMIGGGRRSDLDIRLDAARQVLSVTPVERDQS